MRPRQALRSRRRARALRHRARMRTAVTAAVRTPGSRAATPMRVAQRNLVERGAAASSRARQEEVGGTAAITMLAPAGRAAQPLLKVSQKADWAVQHHPRALPEARVVRWQDSFLSAGARAATLAQLAQPLPAAPEMRHPQRARLAASAATQAWGALSGPVPGAWAAPPAPPARRRPAGLMLNPPQSQQAA